MSRTLTVPPPQPEDHDRDGDPGFHEDPNIFVEFEDGVHYQASLDGSEVAIMADYPDLYPFMKVSVWKLYSQGRGILPPVSLSSTLDHASQDRRSAGCTQGRATKKRSASSRKGHAK